MPTFEIRLWRTLYQACTINVEATDLSAAQFAADDLVDNIGDLPIPGWEKVDEQIDVDNVKLKPKPTKKTAK